MPNALVMKFQSWFSVRGALFKHTHFKGSTVNLVTILVMLVPDYNVPRCSVAPLCLPLDALSHLVPEELSSQPGFSVLITKLPFKVFILHCKRTLILLTTFSTFFQKIMTFEHSHQQWNRVPFSGSSFVFPEKWRII